MAKEFDISVVIVNYNVKDLLLHCIKSIQRASTNLKVETIVVDNDSKDGSIDYLEPKFPDVKFIRLPENIGFGRANNVGFKKAKGKYILILNPDSILEENTLNVMYDYMENNKEVGISGCKVLNSDGTFQLSCRRGFPTPWNSFCKLFGLQTLFPNSKVFAGYNQTFRSIDETYYIEALIGAFMFARAEVVEQINGFDEEFFMYGEDIDFCKKAYDKGWKIAYVHTTSIVHYKGESTKRSSINEIKHFYDAMSIYAKKHFSSSTAFLFFLRLGIFIRSIIAYFSKYSRDFLHISWDIIAVNLSLLIATKFRFEAFFAFPDYAYPTINIVIGAVVFLSMLSLGEYFEGKHLVRRAFSAYMISFFFLSSLTYFFRDYAFSRGVLLLTIGISTVLSTLLRLLVLLYDKTYGKQSAKNVLLVGMPEKNSDFVDKLQSVKTGNIQLIGVVAENKFTDFENDRLPILGTVDLLGKIIENYNINEVIIIDENIKKANLFETLHRANVKEVRFHVAHEYEDLVTSQIINDLTGENLSTGKYNLSLLRYRVIKRLFEILVAFSFLTVALPISLVLINKHKLTFGDLFSILIGKKQLIGTYSKDKKSITGLVQLGIPKKLNPKTIEELNNYYLQNYSLSLDLDILFKFIFR